MRGNPGRYCQIIDGVHKDKFCIFYLKEQAPEFAKAGKVLIHVTADVAQAQLFGEPAQESKSVLIDAKFLKVVGFID